MTPRISKFAAALFLCVSGTAFSAPPSDAQLQELMQVTQVRQVVDVMMGQVGQVMKQAEEQGLQGRQPTPQHQQAMSKMRDRMQALMREEMRWERLEPMYLRLYKESFTQEEVSGLLAFYKSPAGLALTQKMPQLMQRSMQETQVLLRDMTPKMQQIAEEFAAEMQAANKPASKP